MMRLYVDRFWISPYAFSAYLALKEKGLGFQVTTVDLSSKAQLDPGFRDPSITARVPAFEHDGLWLAESSAIVEYLEDAFPATHYPRVLPEDLRERARARQVMAWIRSDLGALREERPTTSIFYQPATEPLSDAGAKAADKLIRVASSVIPDGATQLFRTWSVADGDLALMLMRLIKNDHDVPAKLRTFAEAQWARPAAREWIDVPRPTYVPY
jgi:glutathione S-transferase